jgi:xylulose-5-phosphate/fructose-6-phosphate phosphoketolase
MLDGRSILQFGVKAGYVKQAMRDKLIEHKQCITQHGEDMPEVRNWKWSGSGASHRSDGAKRLPTP